MIRLEEHLVDNPINRNNLRTLISSFEKDSFIPFVGAGPSVMLGASDWEDLVKSLCDKYNLKRVKRIKCDDGTINYPKIFSNISKRITSEDSTAEMFFKNVFDCIEPTKTAATNFHVCLVELFDAYITTNYDLPIEKTFKNKRSQSPKKYFFSCYGINNFDNCIVYIHGHKDINFCIIKSEDYDYFYPSISGKNGIPILEDFLEDIVKNRQIIFIGFSFSDPYIRKFLEHLYLLKGFKREHYWLLSSTSMHYREMLSRAEKYKNEGDDGKADLEVERFFNGDINIKPIVYKNDYHIFIEQLLERLSQASDEKSPVEIAPGKIDGTPVR